LRRHRIINSQFISNNLIDTNSIKINIGAFTGKYILIEFWASWCSPCRALNPQLKRLYEKYKDTNLEIISVSIDLNTKAWKKAIQQDNLNWPQLLEENGPQGEFSKYYDIESIPFKILLDKAGKILGFNLSIEEVENILERNSN
jgi:thiol-disulfide isomerase/thioredoxin